MTRRAAALLALTMGWTACAGDKDGGVAGPGSGRAGSNGVATSGTGGASQSGRTTTAEAAPTGGSGSASSTGGASAGRGGTSSRGVGPSGGAAAAPSTAGGSTGGVSPSTSGVANASGASGGGQGGVGPSSAGGLLSTGGGPAGSAGGGTGGVSTHGGGDGAGSTDVVPSSGGRGARPEGGGSGDPDGGSSGSVQAGSSGSARAGAAGEAPRGLSWPIDCVPEDTCVGLGAPDIDVDGIAYDCSSAPYAGHQGTDIVISWEQMDAGVAVRAAADGEVFFATDGKYDRCPNATEPDCQQPAAAQDVPGDRSGTHVCTEYGPYCGTGTGSCFWCFAGGNVIVLLHEGVSGVFATRYDHLRKGSVLVSPGDRVVRGQMIAEVGSAGASTEPHLHFEVWGTGYYELADPWAGPCGPNLGPSLWANEPPWE